MPDVHPRLLRSFVAVAQELHFGRAAARLYVAQQALSRDVARLEREVGAPLFVRSTRRVRLTPEGERLLPRALELLALHDRLIDEVWGDDRPLLVDALRDQSTAARVLAHARRSAPDRAMEGRFHGGFGAALASLVAHRLDVAFGRSTGSTVPFQHDLVRRLVRHEPLGLMLLEDDPLADQPAIPLAAVAGLTLDTSAGNTAAPEWVELATELVVAHGAIPSPDHHPGMHAVAASGPEETAYHLRATGWPVITLLEVPAVPGAVIRPFVEPVPIYPWTMVHRRDLHHPALAALVTAADRLAAAEGWLDLPPGAWLASGDRSLVLGRETTG